MKEDQIRLLDLRLMIVHKGDEFQTSTLTRAEMDVLGNFYKSDWPHIGIIGRKIVRDAIIKKGYFAADPEP